VVDDGGVATADGVGRRQRRAAQQTTVANDGRAARQSAVAVGRAKPGTATRGRRAGWRGRPGRPRQPGPTAGVGRAGGGGRLASGRLPAAGGRTGGRRRRRAGGPAAVHF
jgi:hypothetical protein